MADIGFTDVDSREPHAFRRKEMIQKHPEIRTLFGTNPWTLAITISLVTAQFGMAFLIADQAWWVILLAAWGVGSFIDHGFFVIVHDSAHNLVFARGAYNKWVGILANSPSIVPSAIGFRNYHLLHHHYQGEPGWDADLASPLEARWVGNSGWRKSLWLLLYPVIMGTIRPAHLAKVSLLEPWALLNAAVTLGAAVLRCL